MVEPTLQTNARALVDARPETVAVFVRNRMHCPGCVMSSFMVVAEAAENHRVDADTILAELRAAGALAEGAAP